MDRKEINSKVNEDSNVYIVYVDYEEERLHPTDIEYYKKPGDAIKRANEIKDSFLNSSNWCLEDGAYAGEITKPDASIMFYNRDSYLEAYVLIYPMHKR